MSRFFDQFTESRLIAAHRGFRACYPENTRCAFEASLGRCHFIELDVRLCGDGTPVVIHDATLERTSDIRALSKLPSMTASVDRMDLARLRLLDMGSWFLSDDPFGTLAGGQVTRSVLEVLMPQRIMTLKELLTWVRRKKLPINLEIKDQGEGPQALLAVPRILEDILASDTGRQVLLSSFNHDYLRHCKRLAPELPTAALVERRHPPDPVTYLRSLGVEAYHVDEASFDPGLTAELKSAGFLVNVYTVNDTKRQNQLFDAGATAIFTDFLPQAL